MVLSSRIRDDHDYLWNSLAALSPMLALISWWLLGRRLARIRNRTSAWNEGLVYIGFGTSFILICMLEIPSLATYRQIVQSMSRIKSGAELESLGSLQTDKARRLVARLCHVPQQFSSDGRLYAVGPVDVFGPLVHISDGFSDPVQTGERLVWERPTIQKLFEKLSSGQKPVPQSWRGLSPWELESPASRD